MFLQRHCRRLSHQSLPSLLMVCLTGALFGSHLFSLTRSGAGVDLDSDSTAALSRGARSLHHRPELDRTAGAGAVTGDTAEAAVSRQLSPDAESMAASAAAAETSLAAAAEAAEAAMAVEEVRRLLFVGVMTADVFLSSRAVAVHDTWASDLAGSYQFFTSEKSTGPRHLPIVRLKGVTDQYPPQKKSFMMFKHMYEHYGNQYEWFMRADDDVYVRTERLTQLLRGVNSSQPVFIGQAGQGSKAEYGRLSLDEKENFCMGGPGIVMSQATLARIYPHIRYCLANMYTTHEDVEIGRCVKRFAGVSCLWNYQMKEIFYNEYRGTDAFAGPLKQRSFLNAITLHPIKSPPLLYRLHHFFLSEMIKEAQMTKIQRHRQIVAGTDPENLQTLPPLTRRLGKPPVLNKVPVESADHVLEWSHMGHRFSINSAHVFDPRISAARHLREGVRDATSSLMDYMLSFTQERGRSLTLQDHNYGYHRVDPLYGVDLTLDLVLKYVRFRGKPMSQKVRRHAYMQQAFGEPEARVVSRRQPAVVNLVVGLAGKLQPFLHFSENMERIGLAGLRVVFVYHENADQEHAELMVQQLQLLQRRHGEAVSVVTTAEPFNRADSLMLGASLLSDDDLLLFIDIDVLFDATALENVRQFVVQGKQVYFPVVFSEYDPNSGLARQPTLTNSESSQQSASNNNNTATSASATFTTTPPPPPPSVHSQSRHFVIDAERGKFRYYGFGVCAMYKSDLKAVGGLNRAIRGWGKEDVDLMERVLRHPANYSVVRCAEPGMVHVHHAISCAADQLSAEQMTMCRGTRYSFMASRRALAWQVCLDERVLQFARHMVKNELTATPAAAAAAAAGGAAGGVPQAAAASAAGGGGGGVDSRGADGSARKKAITK